MNEYSLSICFSHPLINSPFIQNIWSELISSLQRLNTGLEAQLFIYNGYMSSVDI